MGVLRRQLETLEKGYTCVINDSLGKQGAKDLAKWDQDYSYAVRNLFGYESMPYKLSKGLAEDFAASMFKATGKGQEERVRRTMELLGPQQRDQFGQAFLQVVTETSQKPGVPFNPVAWGDKYLQYKPGVKNAVLSPQYADDLDVIAKTFAGGATRQAQAQAIRQAEVEARKATITQSRYSAQDAIEQLRQAKAARQVEIAAQREKVVQAGRAYGQTGLDVEQARKVAQETQGITTATQRQLTQMEKEMSGLRSAASETEKALGKATGTPTGPEAEAITRLKELNRPSGFLKGLQSMNRYIQHRGIWVLGALAIGAPYAPKEAVAVGTILLGASGLQSLLANDRGARIVRMLIKERPGTERALRLGIMAEQLVNQLRPENSEQGVPALPMP